MGGSLIELKKEREKAATLSIEDLLCRSDGSARPHPCGRKCLGNRVWGKGEEVRWGGPATLSKQPGNALCKAGKDQKSPLIQTRGVTETSTLRF